MSLLLQVLFSMWVFTDTSGLKGWANAHKKPLYHQHLYVNVASGEILPKKGCEECSPPNGMKQKIGFHPWVRGKILCKIAESEFPPKKLRELFLLITPFFKLVSYHFCGWDYSFARKEVRLGHWCLGGLFHADCPLRGTSCSEDFVGSIWSANWSWRASEWTLGRFLPTNSVFQLWKSFNFRSLFSWHLEWRFLVSGCLCLKVLRKLREVLRRRLFFRSWGKTPVPKLNHRTWTWWVSSSVHLALTKKNNSFFTLCEGKPEWLIARNCSS